MKEFLYIQSYLLWTVATAYIAGPNATHWQLGFVSIMISGLHAWAYLKSEIKQNNSL